MSQILNSLVVSEQGTLQKELELIMSNNAGGYHMAFVTCDMKSLAEAGASPDILFIENKGDVKLDEARNIMREFPGKIYIVIDPSEKEEERRKFLDAGMDEVMSLPQLQSGIGLHLLERVIMFRQLAATGNLAEDSEERFRGIIENAHDIITLVDAEGTVVYNSPAFARQIGYEPWEVLGQPFSALVHDDDRFYFEREIGELTADDGYSEEGPLGTSLEFRLRHKNGGWRVLKTTVSNLLKNELVQAVVLNSRDVTEEKKAEAELERYRSHLEELVEKRTHELEEALEKEKAVVEQQKSFVSMVSHEFRTPLTIIDGSAQILQKRGATLAPEVLQKRAVTIRAAVERLINLIETILSAHALESGKLLVIPKPCDFAVLIREVCADQQEISPDHKIEVETKDLPAEMLLDKKVIRQMLVNLVSNAVKYAPKSPLIRVLAHREGGDVILQVIDQGIGIPENELARLFTRYFRASTSGGIPGSGLGLSLVKQFVEMHDGKISIQSKEGAGTAVTVRLPIKNE